MLLREMFDCYYIIFIIYLYVCLLLCQINFHFTQTITFINFPIIFYFNGAEIHNGILIMKVRSVVL